MIPGEEIKITIARNGSGSVRVEIFNVSRGFTVGTYWTNPAAPDMNITIDENGAVSVSGIGIAMHSNGGIG